MATGTFTWTVAAPISVLQNSQPQSLATETEPRCCLFWTQAAACLQAAVGPDGKPLLGRISSKVGGLLEELNDMLGAFEGIPAGEGEL